MVCIKVKELFRCVRKRCNFEFVVKSVELLGNLAVAQVVDGADVAVAYIAVGAIAAVADFESDFLIGFTERHPFKDEAVDFLYGEQIVIAAVVGYVRLDLDMSQHEVGHVETGNDFAGGREDYVFQQLQVAVVAEREVGGEEGDFVLDRLQTVAFSAHDLEHVGVLLVGHDG